MARVDMTVYTTKYGEQRVTELFDEFVDYGLFDTEFEAAVGRAIDRIYDGMNAQDEGADCD